MNPETQKCEESKWTRNALPAKALFMLLVHPLFSALLFEFLHLSIVSHLAHPTPPLFFLLSSAC